MHEDLSIPYNESGGSKQGSLRKAGSQGVAHMLVSCDLEWDATEIQFRARHLVVEQSLNIIETQFPLL